jgi:hypothetical protein
MQGFPENEMDEPRPDTEDATAPGGTTEEAGQSAEAESAQLELGEAEDAGAPAEPPAEAQNAGAASASEAAETVSEAPELDVIRAELQDTAPLTMEAGEETAGEGEAAPSLLEAVTRAEAEAEAEAARQETELPVGEGAEAVEAWLESEKEEERPRRNLAMSVPFLAYVGIWLVFSLAMVFALKDVA